jgi:curved DNA-binding protein CbpA
MSETFYDVLGVGSDASQDEVEAAYRERVKETHPDLNDAPDASDAFQRVQAAEAVLGDPDERARYDRLGHASYTSRFANDGPGGGRRWDVGADRRADRPRDGASDERGSTGERSATRGRSATGERSATRGRSAGADHGFGFDPGAYDRTRDATGSGNPSERSYDVGDSDASDGDNAGTNASAGASESAGAGVGGRASAASGATGASATGAAAADDHANWRERARRTERQWSKATQREGRGSNDDDEGGYSVHDWDDDDLETDRNRYRLQGSEAVVVGILFVLYPFMAYSAVTPQFSLFVNATVAVCALALTGYLLTMPRVGFYVFGAWSVIGPLALFGMSGLEAISLVGIGVLGATWIPFGYSVLFLKVLR